MLQVKQKPKNIHFLNWCRFKVAAVILLFTGLRANEVTCLTKQMCDDLINHKICAFYQRQTNKVTTLVT